MDETYIGRGQSRNWMPILVVVGIIILIGGGVFLYLKKGTQIISPVPPKPTYEVIFYTPTPGQSTPASTPSATPKVKKSTPTTVPTIAPTAKPTSSQTP